MFYIYISKKIVAITGVQETSCKLCLKTVTVNGFEVINNVIREGLLLKLKFDSEGKDVICNVCRRKFNAALEFKSTCLNTDYTINRYVDSEEILQLDIRDVYTKENTSESIDISDSQKICRLGMHPVESEFRHICEEELEAIGKLAPEMNINIIKDPVVCKECFESVCTHNSFLKNCLEVQEKIGGIFNSAATESQIDTSPSDLFVKTEYQDNEFDIKEMEMSIKAESIDVKSEDQERSDSLLQSSNSESFEKSVFKDAEKDGCKHENRSTNQYNTKVEQEFYKCDKCIYKSGSETRFIEDRARHGNDSEAYKCESCKYETENKKIFQKPGLRHEDPSEMCMHRCGSREKRLYECDFCDFKTKRKVSFNSHYIKHKNSNNCVELTNKDISQLPIYKCDSCTYESKIKTRFTKHQLKLYCWFHDKLRIVTAQHSLLLVK
ncbi:uncharacterized protein LOC111692355 [Anoplophora glabripennis]|uniref:uncharacterized protein LOC111692355 n=1 Tax=Anoplophora glabripennis TaxID=217634 RepID=UPI000C778885|nr:uncharacterized protein LOC111692355 [Anoplophora glabripennis]